MTDDATFEEAAPPPRCPACLAAIEADQQYCLQCGERLAPAGPPAGSPLQGGKRPPAAALVAVGTLLLVLGGFGIAYGFTREDETAATGASSTGKTTKTTGTTVPSVSGSTIDTGVVPTFTEVPPTTGFPTDTGFTQTTPTTPTTPTTGTTSTQPTSTEESSDWPEGLDAWAVLLASKDTEQFDFAYITQQKANAEAKGFDNAGVLNSDDYFTLNPGYWVLYLGPYDTKSEAQAAQADARAAGYSDAYVRRVAE